MISSDFSAWLISPAFDWHLIRLENVYTSFSTAWCSSMIFCAIFHSEVRTHPSSSRFRMYVDGSTMAAYSRTIATAVLSRSAFT